MLNRRTLASLALTTFAYSAHAAPDTDLQQIREEIAQLRANYEVRISDLEARLKQAEQHADKVTAAGETPPNLPPPAPQSAAGSSANAAFNPAISLILSGQYANLSRDPTGFRIAGFRLPTDVRAELAPQRSFSLSESELGISANIDHLFSGALNFAIHPDNTVSTEEAYMQTTALGSGLSVKAGRFFSGIGYLNEQHAHAWDFIDAPLPYQAFLGGQFNDDGVQVRWLAPTDLFVETGLEAGRGARYPGTDRGKNGAGATAIYLHVGGDIGVDNSWRAGLSRLATSPRNRDWTEVDGAGNDVTGSFSGTSRLWIADAVWKWAPNGNPYRTNFKLQGEYFRRSENGVQAMTVAPALAPNVGNYSAAQSGWYIQGLYQWAPTWRGGLRSERLATNRLDDGANDGTLVNADHRPSRNSLVIDYQPSEFSRLRLQFARDRSQPGAADNQLYVQYLMSIGAHGAHKF